MCKKLLRKQKTKKMPYCTYVNNKPFKLKQLKGIRVG